MFKNHYEQVQSGKNQHTRLGCDHLCGTSSPEEHHAPLPDQGRIGLGVSVVIEQLY